MLRSNKEKVDCVTLLLFVPSVPFYLGSFSFCTKGTLGRLCYFVTSLRVPFLPSVPKVPEGTLGRKGCDFVVYLVPSLPFVRLPFYLGYRRLCYFVTSFYVYRRYKGKQQRNKR